MRPLWLPLAFFALSAQATDIYRWTDADGVVHYTDQATPGAEKIRIESSSTYKAPVVTPPATSGKAKPPATPANKYDVQITSPSQQEVLWNIGAEMPVSVRIQPELRAGDAVRLYLDNTAVEGSSADATQFQLKDVYRGVHTLRADVVDSTGKIMSSSSPVTFSVQQTSLLNPNRPAVTPH